MNEGGFKLTITPFGGMTEHRYVSCLLPMFFKLRRTFRDPFSSDIVTEGRFRSER